MRHVKNFEDAEIEWKELPHISQDELGGTPFGLARSAHFSSVPDLLICAYDAPYTPALPGTVLPRRCTNSAQLPESGTLLF